jgi:hypothetical protein
MRNTAFHKSLRFTALIFLVITCGHSMAKSTMMEALQQCASINDDSRRLSCFDDVMSLHLPGADHNTATAGVPVRTEAEPGVPAETVTTAGDEVFGKEHWIENDDKLTSIESRVERVAKSSQGHLIVTLANGQVWKQRNVKRFQLREGDTVVIERGSFNSFFLKVKDESRPERFYRIQ